MAKFMENKHPQDLVNLALAVLLFISPWVLGFSMDRNPAGNAWISVRSRRCVPKPCGSKSTLPHWGHARGKASR